MVIGVAPPGFCGETLRSDPPDLWIPVEQEPLIADRSALLRQSAGAWLRMLGRLRPGGSINGLAPRLSGVLRRWMQYDSGYPANGMPEVIRTLPKQAINVVPALASGAEMKEEYGLQILLAVCGLVQWIACAKVANLLRASRANGRQAAHGRHATPDHCAGSYGKRPPRRRRWHPRTSVAVAAARLLLTLAFHSAHFLPISPAPSLVVLVFAFALTLGTGVIFGAAPAWFATRTDPAEALRGPGRNTTDRSSVARRALLVAQAALSVVFVAGATMLGRSLNKPGFRISRSRARGRGAAQSARQLRRGQAGSALPPA
jgi:hypothetical protein